MEEEGYKATLFVQKTKLKEAIAKIVEDLPIKDYIIEDVPLEESMKSLYEKDNQI